MFKSLLDKLSISAKEAVIDGNADTFDDFKDYLHIDRFVERKFEEILLAALDSEKPQLILLSGNVGDGKSHILARMYRKYPEQMSAVEVRNDATESRDVEKDWVAELTDFLGPFSSARLKNSGNHAKRVVAINLGVLSSFLHMRGDEFKELHDFVNRKGIIDRIAGGNHFDPAEYYQFLNFADYNLFTIRQDEASSTLIRNVLERVTADEADNPFHSAFNAFYLDHPNTYACPIRFNYLQLSKPEVQKGLATLIVYAIIKFKLIISIRDLLDFIYNLIVPSELASLSGPQIKQLYLSGSHPQVMPNVFYNILFDNQGRAELFDSVQLLDPVRYRSAALDDLIFRISSTDDPDKLFTDHQLEVIPYARQNALLPERKALLVKTFIRSLYLNDTGFFEGELKYFHQFSHYLYCYYAGDTSGLKPLYRDMIKAIYYWNGNSKLEKEVNVPVGRRQLEYNVTQTIVLNPDIRLRPGGSAAAEINEFDLSFPVGIKAGVHGIVFKLDIDLFVLLQNVIRGYSPNRQDREDHINFQQAIDQITTAAGQEQAINFEKIGGSMSEKFQLSYVPGFGYEFKKL